MRAGVCWAYRLTDNNFRFIFAPIKKEPLPCTPAQPSNLGTAGRKISRTVWRSPRLRPLPIRRAARETFQNRRTDRRRVAVDASIPSANGVRHRLCEGSVCRKDTTSAGQGGGRSMEPRQASLGIAVRSCSQLGTQRTDCGGCGLLHIGTVRDIRC